MQTLDTDPATWGDAGDAPLIVEVLRRGTFYMLYVNGSHLTHQPVMYAERPSSDVHCQQHSIDQQQEPLGGFAGYRDVSGGVFQLNGMRVTE